MPSVHISLRAETLFQLFGIPVTNALLTTWLAMAVLIILAIIATRKINKIPGSLQNLMELAVGGVHDLFKDILQENNKRFFPFLMTLFLFIVFNNWAGLLPGVGTIGLTKHENKEIAIARPVLAVSISEAEKNAGESAVKAQFSKENTGGENKEETAEFIPLFRSGSADLNMTLALAILTVGYIQFAGLSTLGLSYLKKFFNLSNPINFVVGILELISEFARIISFAFRLFGNIFAGEVLLTVIAFLVPLLAPIPFLGLELFVGLIQALVFPLLAAVFFSMAVVAEEH